MIIEEAKLLKRDEHVFLLNVNVFHERVEIDGEISRGWWGRWKVCKAVEDVLSVRIQGTLNLIPADSPEDLIGHLTSSTL